MAERRMFAKKIIDSDDFLDMPLSAQALYFHLGMRADDDGFVNNARIIYRLIGASADDLKLLIDGKYLTDFKNGIMVINHWKINNFIRKDRYVETMFLREKQQLFCDDTGAYIVETNQAYTVPKTTQNLWSTNGQPVVNQWSTNGQPSIGKDSIDKVSLGKSSIGEERIEKINLGEGSVNTTPAPYYENKYEEVFSSDRAIAPSPTEEYFLEDHPYCEAQYLTKGQPRCEASNSSEEKFYLPDGDGYIPEALDVSCNVNARSALEPFAENEKAFPSGGRGTALAVDEVLSSESDRAPCDDMRSESARETSLKPVGGPYGRGKAFPGGGRGIALAVDEVLPSESDKAPYDMHSESAGDTSLKPVGGPYGREEAFPSGGRGTDLAVDEVLPSESDKAPYDMHSESARDTSLKPVGGPYGRGIVCLTDGQLADLKDRLGESQLNRYMDKLSSFISSRGARIKSHYNTIIKWYEDDSKNGIAETKPQTYSPSYNQPAEYKSEKPRYGSFDYTEAFRLALERSRREYELEMEKELNEGTN